MDKHLDLTPRQSFEIWFPSVEIVKLLLNKKKEWYVELKKNDRNLSTLYIYIHILKLLLIVQESETKKEIPTFSRQIYYIRRSNISKIHSPYAINTYIMRTYIVGKSIFFLAKRKEEEEEEEEYIIAQRMQSLITGVKQRFPV